MPKESVRTPKHQAKEDQKKLAGPGPSKAEEKDRIEQFKKLFKDVKK